MKKLKFIKRSNGSHWVGNGFPVQNIFSYHDIAKEMSPFLLMDYAGPATFPSTSSELGVGAHPHRGFETVTIVYSGGVSHRDSSGGGGTIGPGGVQWMTAASGLIHEEFHSREFAKQGGLFEVIQLWVNLPADQKMGPPGYQPILAGEIPKVAFPWGFARIIAGSYQNVIGPAKTHTPMNVWDLRLYAGHRVQLDLPKGDTAGLFVLRGVIDFDGQHSAGPSELAVLERDDDCLEFDVSEDAWVLLLDGEPIEEPIVGHGPFVMNTEQEIDEAFRDFNEGRFGNLAA